MMSLSVRSQNITSDGSVTSDNEVITPDESKSDVAIHTDLLPLWYTTILELQKSEAVIDSLRASIEMYNKNIRYQAGQIVNYKKQVEKVNLMNKNLQGQLKILSDDADSMTKYYLRWRLIGRVSIGVAAFFAIVAIAK